MLTDLDAELFPDDCEVVEIPLHDRHVYLIQKNGSSSLRRDAAINNWTMLRNHDLNQLQTIDIYLRDPEERYLSGVNTFAQQLVRDNPKLDHSTCVFFATRYRFLNRHYLPQWHWLLNLSRWISPDCVLRLHPLRDLLPITASRTRAGIQPLSVHQVQDILPHNHDLEFWFLMDLILLGRCGQQLTWKEILQIYVDHPADPMQVILSRMQDLQRVLS